MAKSKKRPIPALISDPRFSVNIDGSGTKVTVFRETTLMYAVKLKDRAIVEVVNITFGRPGIDRPKVVVNIDECD